MSASRAYCLTSPLPHEPTASRAAAGNESKLRGRVRSGGSSGGGEPGCDARKSAATHGSAKPEGEESRLRAVTAGRCRRRARRAPGGSASWLLSDSIQKPGPRTDGGRCSALYFDEMGNTLRYSGHGRSMVAPQPTILHVRPSSAAASASSLRVPPTCERVQRNRPDGAVSGLWRGGARQRARRTSTGPSARLTSIGAGGGAHKPPLAPRGARRCRARPPVLLTRRVPIEPTSKHADPIYC